MRRVWNAHLEQHWSATETCGGIELLTVDGTRDVEELVEMIVDRLFVGGGELDSASSML